MKKILSIICCAAATLGLSYVAKADTARQNKADKDTKEWKYEIETVGKNNQGNYIVKVWSFSKTSSIAEEQGKKNAIHAICFQGLPDSVNSQSVHGIKPLVNNPAIEQEKAEWFDEFFENGGAYMRFVTISNSGFSDVQKLSKDYIHGIKGWDVKYKVGITVTVNVQGLRKYLEQNGIINSLSGRF